MEAPFKRRRNAKKIYILSGVLAVLVLTAIGCKYHDNLNIYYFINIFIRKIKVISMKY